MVDVAGLANSALSIFVIIVSVVVAVVAVIWGFSAVSKWRRYRQFVVRVWEKDGFGQLQESGDVAGIFVERKTGDKRFFLKRYNVGLTPDNIPYLPHGGKKVVMLYRNGHKNFHFIRPDVSDERIVLKVGEEDVNWGLHAYEKQKKMFTLDSLMAYMPFIALAFVSIIILIIFIYFFREFDTLQAVAVALQGAADSMAKASGGTVVVS